MHFWRISRFDLFLIDWERPRSCEANHFTLKNNLETSSVCSSVRTFATENVSTWRIIFIANEWIRLSVKQQHSAAWQGLLVLPLAQVEGLSQHIYTYECVINAFEFLFSLNRFS